MHEIELCPKTPEMSVCVFEQKFLCKNDVKLVVVILLCSAIIMDLLGEIIVYNHY